MRADELEHDDLARALRGFGPPGWLGMLAILAGSLVLMPLGAALVLLWTWRSGTPWRAIGFTRPMSWWRTIVLGLLLGAAFKLAMKAVVMPLLGAPTLNPRYHFVAGNVAVLPAMLFAVIVGAGFGEEVVFRGYLFERLGHLWGTGARGKALTVLATSALFAGAHYADQGWPGVEQAAITGLVFGTIYARTQQLPFLMIAHATFDLTAVALIYLRLESRVAHLFFR